MVLFSYFYLYLCSSSNLGIHLEYIYIYKELAGLRLGMADQINKVEVTLSHNFKDLFRPSKAIGLNCLDIIILINCCVFT